MLPQPSAGGSGDSCPVGTILPYIGTIANIPRKWALCDGSNGTPDLRDRFFVGAGYSYGLGAIGGENFHILTLDEMPAHSHLYFDYCPENGWDGNYMIAGGAGDNHRQPYYRYTEPAGSSYAHENRPPFYAVYWIMKVKA